MSKKRKIKGRRSQSAKTNLNNLAMKAKEEIFECCCDWLGVGDIVCPQIVIDPIDREDMLFGSVGLTSYNMQTKKIGITSVSIDNQRKIRKSYGYQLNREDSLKELLAEEFTHFLHIEVLAPLNIREIVNRQWQEDQNAFFHSMAAMEAVGACGVLRAIEELDIKDDYFTNLSLRTQHCFGSTRALWSAASQGGNVEDNPWAHLFLQGVIKYLSCKMLDEPQYQQLVLNTAEFVRGWSPLESLQQKSFVVKELNALCR